MIYIIIPNFNGIKHLDTCFKSLQNQSYNEFKIVLVDNGSTDGSIKFTSESFPKSETISLNKNMGFAKAVNTGIKFAISNSDCEKVLLLNNDIECDKYMLEEMLVPFQNENIGSVGCKMLNFSNRNIFDDTGNFIDSFGYPFQRGHLKEDLGQYENPGFIFGACAGAALYKSDIFKNIGFFDEDFFAYYEDIDLSLRMQLFGFQSYYNPKAICYHKGSATSGQNSNFKIFYVEKNLLLFKLKNYPIKVLILKFPLYSILTIKRMAGYFLKESPSKFWWAIKGLTAGFIQSTKILKKRKELRKLQNISFYDIKFDE